MIKDEIDEKEAAERKELKGRLVAAMIVLWVAVLCALGGMILQCCMRAAGV